MPLLRFGAVFLASRISLIAIVSWATGGSEISGDVAMHIRMMQAPLEPLFGRGAFAQHPPLLAPLEAAVFRGFAAWTTTFVAVRCAYVVFETLAAVFAFAAIRAALGAGAGRRAGFMLCALPCGFMASAVMPQDECIAYCFVAAAMLAAVQGRTALGLAILAFGVVSAKLILLVPLLAWVILSPAPRLPVRLACALGPVAGVYAIAWIAQEQAALPAVLHFAPRAAFSVNAWALFSAQVAPDLARLASSFLGLALAAIAVVRAARSSTPDLALAEFGAALAALAWFLVGFYLVNPEYFALLMPALALRLRSGWRMPLAFIATALPWLANFAYSVQYCATHDLFDGAKGRIARYYLQLGAVSPAALHAIAVIATTLATAAVAWALQRRDAALAA